MDTINMQGIREIAAALAIGSLLVGCGSGSPEPVSVCASLPLCESFRTDGESNGTSENGTTTETEQSTAFGLAGRNAIHNGYRVTQIDRKQYIRTGEVSSQEVTGVNYDETARTMDFVERPPFAFDNDRIRFRMNESGDVISIHGYENGVESNPLAQYSYGSGGVLERAHGGDEPARQYAYDANGLLNRIAYSGFDSRDNVLLTRLNATTVEIRYENASEENLAGQLRAFVRLDVLGRIIEMTRYGRTSPTFFRTQYFDYDGNGNMSRTRQYHADGSLDQTVDFSYEASTWPVPNLFLFFSLLDPTRFT